MNVVLIFDQGLAGAGGKSNPNVELIAKRGGIGSYLMMEPHFKAIDANVLATLYCGNQYFINHQEEVIQKMVAMITKLNPDYIVCGPCFDFADFSLMSAMITQRVVTTTKYPACAMMSQENESVIQAYKDKIDIVRMPKKGGTGLNDSFKHLTMLMEASCNATSDKTKIVETVCFK